MKFHLTALASLVLALTACSEPSNPTPPASEPAKTATAPASQHAEKYTVGIDVSIPPFTSRDEQGLPAGFDVDILNAIADDQKISLEFIHAPFGELFPDLANGKYQILSAAMKVTTERAEKAELTDSYAQSYRAILNRTSDVAKTGKDLTGKKVAVQQGSSSHSKLNEAGITAKTYPSLFEAFRAFMNGEVDYVVDDSVALDYYLKGHAKDKLADYTLTEFDNTGSQPTVFAVTKGNTALLKKLNAGLENIKINGIYDKIYQKHFGEVATPAETPAEAPKS